MQVPSSDLFLITQKIFQAFCFSVLFCYKFIIYIINKSFPKTLFHWYIHDIYYYTTTNNNHNNNIIIVF